MKFFETYFFNLPGEFIRKYTTLPMILVTLLIVYFLKKLINMRRNINNLAYKGIPKAEDGSIVNQLKPTFYAWVVDFDNKEYDQRLVEVMAYIIQSIPVLQMIPKRIVVSFLSKVIQNIFDKLKASLDVQRRPNHVKISEDLVKDTLTEDNTEDQEKYKQKVNDVLTSILDNVEIMEVTENIDPKKIQYIKDQIKKIL